MLYLCVCLFFWLTVRYKILDIVSTCHSITVSIREPRLIHISKEHMKLSCATHNEDTLHVRRAHVVPASHFPPWTCLRAGLLTGLVWSRRESVYTWSPGHKQKQCGKPEKRRNVETRKTDRDRSSNPSCVLTSAHLSSASQTVGQTRSKEMPWALVFWPDAVGVQCVCLCVPGAGAHLWVCALSAVRRNQLPSPSPRRLTCQPVVDLDLFFTGRQVVLVLFGVGPQRKVKHDSFLKWVNIYSTYTHE